MKHYVYALCKKMEMIVAALSCPDEKTAKLAYVAACQDVGRDLEDSLCGIVRVEEDAMIKIHGNDGRDIKLRFGIGDFELAEKQTKVRIGRGRASGWCDNFMRSVEFALEELTSEIDPAMHAYSEATNTARTGLFPKLEHGAEIIGHAIGGVLHSVFGYTKEKPATISQPHSHAYPMHTANGNGHQKSAVEAFSDLIEWTDEPANVNLNGIDPTVLPIPVNVVAQPKPVIVAAVAPAVVAINGLNDRLGKPIPVYQVRNPNSIIRENIDDLLDRINTKDTRWVSAQEYADARGCKVSTLRKYRETDNGVVFSLKNPLMGMDKSHNIFLKTGREQNAPCLYLLRACASHARHGR